MNLLPEHLDYPFTQLLFIGEKSSITGEEAIDQLEKLEEEDEARVNHLKGMGVTTPPLINRGQCGVQGLGVE